jgi:N6-adenosine-specific RNA methylase IME4
MPVASCSPARPVAERTFLFERQSMEFHEIAQVFPMLPDSELATLADDIKANGLHHAITTLDGKILDGRNRYAACVMAEVEPRFKEYIGDNPLAFVISENIARRHLDESQRAMCAGRIAEMKRGQFFGNQSVSANLQTPSQVDAANMLNVSPRSVASAKTIIAKGIPELVWAVDAGQIPVSEAEKLARQTQEYQQAIIAKVSKGIKPQEAKRQVLAESYKESPVLPQDKKYRVIYADPPWSYGNTQIDGFKEQRDHYPVMSLADICAMPIKDLSEENAVLFLWVTSPMLKESFDVIKAWGFEYKASFVWDKVDHVMGHYNSVRHEFLLVCVRGSCQPDVRKLFDSVVTEERTEHSKKPETFRQIIETLYTAGGKLELFGRERHKGWTVWGNEIIS